LPSSREMRGIPRDRRGGASKRRAVVGVDLSAFVVVISLVFSVWAVSVEFAATVDRSVAVIFGMS
jgi:glucose dehydrogenase